MADGIGVLVEVVAKAIAGDEDGDRTAQALLGTELIGTTAGKGGHRGLERGVVGNHLTEAATGADGLIADNLGGVDTGGAIELEPGLKGGFGEACTDPRLALVGQLKRCGDTVVLKFLKGAATYAPYIGQREDGKGFTALGIGIDHADAAIAGVLLGKLAAYLGQGLGTGNAYTDGDIGVETDLIGHTAHEVFELEIALVAVEIAEALVDGVVLGALNRLAKDIDHTLAHGCIELHIGGEEGDMMGIDNGADLEDGIATTEAQGLGLGGEGHNAAIVAGKDADGLVAEAGMEDLLDRAEEAIAID